MKTCEKCGEVNEYWELRCTRCSLKDPTMPDSYCILIIRPSLRFRLATGLLTAVGLTLIGVLAYFIAMGIRGFLPQVLTDTILTLSQIVLSIAEFFVFLICFAGVYISLGEIRSKAMFEVTKTKIHFSNITYLYDSIDDDVPSEIKFTDKDFNLVDARKIRVQQGWLGRHLGYGNIEIFRENDLKPSVVISGVVKPDLFKQRLELLLNPLAIPDPATHTVNIQGQQKNQNYVGTNVNAAPKKGRFLPLTLLILCGLSFVAINWIGSWYKDTIPKWDYCVQNNLCFVCYQPAQVQEMGDFSEDIRLCAKHSNMWYFLVYGVPASLLIYQDAPLGTGWFFQPIIRGALIGFWFFGLLLSGIGILLAPFLIVFPRTKFSLWLNSISPI